MIIITIIMGRPCDNDHYHHYYGEPCENDDDDRHHYYDHGEAL